MKHKRPNSFGIDDLSLFGCLVFLALDFDRFPAFPHPPRRRGDKKAGSLQPISGLATAQNAK